MTKIPARCLLRFSERHCAKASIHSAKGSKIAKGCVLPSLRTARQILEINYNWVSLPRCLLPCAGWRIKQPSGLCNAAGAFRGLETRHFVLTEVPRFETSHHVTSSRTRTPQKEEARLFTSVFSIHSSVFNLDSSYGAVHHQQHVGLDASRLPRSQSATTSQSPAYRGLKARLEGL